MILPGGLRGAAFGTAADGDPRTDAQALRDMASRLAIPAEWATVSQVHGDAVVVATGPGSLGAGDAILTFEAMLPVAIATADCLPIVIEGSTSVAVVHAGWRGLAAGVVESAIAALRRMGDEPVRAAIGPAIGPCCYEVGDDVAVHFPGFSTVTTWGTRSVDLPAIAAARLPGLEVWVSDRCTMTDPELYSHRRDRTTRRQVTVAWLPSS